MSRSNTRQTHPLIPREQTYVLDRKILSVHSIDRDIKKWPHSNHFEINLPETLTNVQSMRLVEISLPSNQYVFSNEYQNTKLSFCFDCSHNNPIHTITLDEGSYTPLQLATTITKLMNEKGEAFECAYNSISNTFWFGHKTKNFTLLFDTPEIYTNLCPGQPNVWNNYTRWGLPAYLGYQKQRYTSIATTATPLPAASSFEPSFSPKYYIDPRDVSNNICNLDIYGEDAIYMEIDRYNSMDEIEPYSTQTSQFFNNDYNGKVNSAFAKIPMNVAKHYNPFAQVFESRTGSLTNISHYYPPIERISRLRFRFRYHDGRLVDFKCLPFSFSLEFNMLKDEQYRPILVRIPPLYDL